jgi:hypothetical protein
MSTPVQKSRHSSLSAMPEAQGLLRADKVGMWASLACTLHCAALPLLLAVVPALGLNRAAMVDADQAFTIFATVLGISTLAFGYRRHRVTRAWWLLLPGLALVWINTYTALHSHGGAHLTMMVSGGLLIAAAHLLNTRLLRRNVAPCATN